MRLSNLGQTLRLAARAARHKITRYPLVLTTIEVTKRCNAKCAFCSYWQEAPQLELEDYASIVRHFKPLAITLSGGEPLMRSDFAEVIRKIRAADRAVYITMVTNGWLLSKEKARVLREAGLNQLSISLDYADERHDAARVLPGLYAKIVSLLPDLALIGFEVLSLNVVIKNDNLKDVPKIIELARARGVKIGISSYFEFKNKVGELHVSEENMRELEELIAYLRQHKKKYRTISSSEYYLDHIAEYFKTHAIPGCRAGINWVQVTPAGEVKACSEFPVVQTNFAEYNPKKAPAKNCARCWYSCRGEAQAPVSLKRLKDIW
jgi:MoaA/NifB/PqqE/SkfB family radical SAM enzyme